MKTKGFPFIFTKAKERASPATGAMIAIATIRGKNL
jgi:hypothetical protein